MIESLRWAWFNICCAWWNVRQLVQTPTCQYCDLAERPIWGKRCEVCTDEKAY